MKLFTSWVWLVFLITGAGVNTLSAQTNANLLPNPGFEKIKDGWPEFWVKQLADPETAIIGLDNQVKHSGQYSLHIKFNPDAGPKVRPVIIVTPTTEPMFLPGHTYTYSAYIKTKDLDGKANLEAIQYPAPFKAEYNRSSQSLRGDNDWTRVSLTFTTRPDIANIQFRCQTHSVPGKLKGEVWFDDCKIEEGSALTDYTDTWKTDYYIGCPKLDWFCVPFDFQVSTNYVTPHAAPSSSPRAVKMPVAIAMFWGNLRTAVELAERADIQPITVAISAKLNSEVKKIHMQCAQRLRDILNQNPKALVVDPDTWELLVSEDRDDIEKRVRQGMGLVFYDSAMIGPYMEEFLKKGAKQPTPHSQGTEELFYVYQFDQGVVVRLVYRIDMKNTFTRELGYDRGIRAIYAAAKKPVGNLKLGTVPALLPAGQSWKLEAELSSLADNAPAQLCIRLRPNIARNLESLSTTAIPIIKEVSLPFPGKTETEMEGLPAGNWFIEASVRDKNQQVIAWQLLPIVVDGPVRIWSITPEETMLRPGQPLKVKVLFENNSGTEQLLTLCTSLIDTEERLLTRTPAMAIDLAPGRTEKQITIGASHSATPMVRLWLDVERDGKIIERREHVLSAETLIREPDFRFAFSGENNHAQACRDLGADTVVGSAIPELGLSAYPWISIMCSVPYPRAPCRELATEADAITNPETIAKASKILSDKLGELLPFHSVAFILQDEWTHEFKPSPYHLAYFKQFLRQSYGTIKTLNQSWNTRLNSFDEVSLDYCSSTAIRNDPNANPVPWADLQTAMEQAVADYIAALHQAAAKIDPDVRLGLSGTQDPTTVNGLDWWRLMKVCRSIATYGGVHTCLEDSFKQPGTRIYQWSYPTDGQVGRSRHDPWRDLFYQRDGYLHFGSGYSDLFMPDYSPYPAARTIGQEIEAIRRGPARLVRGAQREYYGIAILFSMSSYHAAYLPVLRQTGSDYMNDILNSTMNALVDARLDARFVSYEQLAQGQVTPKTFKALLLPYAQALSAAEVKAIRQFAEAGGVVIADVRPGIYDEHCKKLGAGQLDDMFGIGAVGRGLTMSNGKFEAALDSENNYKAAVHLGENDLVLAGAVSHGEVTVKEQSSPAVLIHPYGKGKAILLNFAYPDYLKYRAGGTGGEVGIETQAKEALAIRDFFGRLLEKEVPVLPVAHLPGPDGTEMRKVRMHVYRDGPATYIGLLPEYSWVEGEKPVFDGTLRLSQPGHVYDVRQGQYLGRTNTIPVKIQETYAKLYAVLPYQVTALQLTAPNHAKAGETIPIQCQISAQGGKAGRHVVVVRLKRPDGTEPRSSRFTFEAPDGGGKAEIFTALNDMPGEWKLLVTDAASGVGAQTTIRILAAPSQPMGVRSKLQNDK